MTNNIKLHAHHGMCFKFFKGYGYSDDFSVNMAEVINKLTTEDPVIEVVAESDLVCAKCPNRRGNGCASQGKVIAYDEGVLNAVNITPHTQMKYSEFSKLISDIIIDKGLREEICGDCQWTDLCH